MKNHACSIVINGNHTDIALKIYSNRLLLIITDIKKLGTLISVNRVRLFQQYNNVYSTRVLFGKDDDEILAAVRYIAEKINADKPLLISISLKDYKLDTLKAIVTAINDIKSW